MSSRQVLIVSIVLIAVTGFAAHLSPTGKELNPGPENIVYISLDALSTEHMECYGYDRTTAPNICGLDGATIYTNAYAASFWTPIALASMQRGVYAHKTNLVNETTPMNSTYPSTAAILNRSGYRTFGVSNHASMSSRLGFFHGFDRVERAVKYHEMPFIPEKFGRELDSDRLYFRIHVVGSHDPYIPSLGFSNYTGYKFVEDFNRSVSYLVRKKKVQNVSDDTYQSVINHYDENIRYADRYVGEFIAKLKERGEYKDSLIIITADHGESFNDYGEGTWRHENPNPSVARIPLVVKYPGSGNRGRNSELVSHMDPFKIIMNEVGVNLSYEVDAIDPRVEDRKLHYTYVKREAFAVTNRTHLLWTRDLDSWNYYRIQEEDIEKVSPESTGLKDDLIEFRREVFNGNYTFPRRSYREKRDLDKERKRLKNLGYLE